MNRKKYLVSIIETVAYDFPSIKAASRQEAEEKAQVLLDEFNEGRAFGSPVEGERIKIYTQLSEA